MDEQKLQHLLSSLDAPEPSENAKNQAVSSALAAFEQKKPEKTQGVRAARRLTDIANVLTHVRRTVMKKSHVLSGMSGAVAVCAVMAVLGTPFISEQMTRIAGQGENVGVKPVRQNQLGDTPQNAVPVYAGEASQSKPDDANLLPSVPKEQEAIGGVTAGILKHPVMIGNEIKAKMSDERGGDKKGPVMKQVLREERAFGAALPSSSIAMQFRDVQQQFYKDVGRDNFKDFEENAVKMVAAEPVSTFSIDVDTASYGFMRRQLNNGVLPQKDAIRVEELINYFDYNYELPGRGEDPFKPTVAVYDSPWKAGNKIVHLGIKGYNITEKPKSNLVFLIDTSGSMNSQDKLPLLVNSFKLMLDGLNPDDTVGIVVYAGSAGTVLEPTKAGDKQKIIEALERLSAGGSTAGAEGIRQAYALAEKAFIKEGNNRIILATDGDFNVGITNPEELKDFVERKRGEGVYLSVLGFGQGNYNDLMMQALAQNGNGNAAYIDSLNEARKVLVEEAGSTLFTIAKDVKIQVEFNPALVQEYRLVGYETRHLNREDFNNDKVDAGEVGAGATVTAIYEITPRDAAPAIDPLRYGDKERVEPMTKPATGEYAFLKIRYKKPDSDTSTLMTRAITGSDERKLDQLSDNIRFASAVAGFGQLLKGGKYTGSLTYDQVIETANAARGKDEFGYRTEFVNLVRLAKSAAALEPQK